MKGILEFKLPKENIDFFRAVRALDVTLALWDIQQEMYKDHESAQEVKDKIFEIFEAYNINLDDIIE